MPLRIFTSRAYQFAADARVGGEDRVVGQPRRQLAEHALRVDRLGRVHRARVEQLPPLVDVVGDLVAPRAIVPCAAAAAAARAASARLSPDQVQLHRIADAQHLRDRCRSARRAPALLAAGTPSTESCEPTISSVSQFVIMSQLGFVPSRPIEPVTNGKLSGTTALPSSALAMPAPSRSATSQHLVRRRAARPRRPASRPSCRR